MANYNKKLRPTKEIELIYNFSGFSKLLRSDPEVCRAAVQAAPKNLAYVEYQDEEMCLSAVSRVPATLKYVKNKTDLICETAIRYDNTGNLIKLVENQTEKILLYAVAASPFAITNINNPSDKIKLHAIKNHFSAIKHVKDPDEQMIYEAAKNCGLLILSMIDAVTSMENRRGLIKGVNKYYKTNNKKQKKQKSVEVSHGLILGDYDKFKINFINMITDADPVHVKSIIELSDIKKDINLTDLFTRVEMQVMSKPVLDAAVKTTSKEVKRRLI